MRSPLKIRIEVDGEVAELTGDQITEGFTWHNLRDSNHCRRVRQKIFEAVLAIASDETPDATAQAAITRHEET